MTNNEKIVAARVLLPASFGDMAMVMIKLDGETEERKLFDYFHDEISFTAQELVGLTADQAHDLRHKKDVAYLQS
jgi:hypothetical protein